MKIIAHRGGMGKGMQNSPEGVWLAASHGADFVELDILNRVGGTFSCSHGLGVKSRLEDCLAELGDDMDLVAHLKGSYQDEDLSALAETIGGYRSLDRVVFASHDSNVLRRLRKGFPQMRLARFGFFPAIAALWVRPPWDICMINHAVLLECHVKALQRRGLVVFASCVWEMRGRDAVKRLGVDGAFVNLP